MEREKEMQKKAAPSGEGQSKAEPYDPLKEEDGFAWARRVAEAEDAGLD